MKKGFNTKNLYLLQHEQSTLGDMIEYVWANQLIHYLQVCLGKEELFNNTSVNESLQPQSIIIIYLFLAYTNLLASENPLTVCICDLWLFRFSSVISINRLNSNSKSTISVTPFFTDSVQLSYKYIYLKKNNVLHSKNDRLP